MTLKPVKNPARVHTTCNLWGKNQIGEGTTIGAFCDIGGAIIGKNCKIQCHVSIPPGTVIGDEVFIGPGARFANDKMPQIGVEWEPMPVHVGNCASIGMGAMIGAGVTIGEFARIGMGAVVTKDVPEYQTWVGVPAKNIYNKL